MSTQPMMTPQEAALVADLKAGKITWFKYFELYRALPETSPTAKE